METSLTHSKNEEFNPLNMCQTLIKEENESSPVSEKLTNEKCLTQLTSLQQDDNQFIVKEEQHYRKKTFDGYNEGQQPNCAVSSKPFHYPVKEERQHPDEHSCDKPALDAVSRMRQPIKMQCDGYAVSPAPNFSLENSYQLTKRESKGGDPPGTLGFGHQWNHFLTHENKTESFPGSSQIRNGLHLTVDGEAFKQEGQDPLHLQDEEPRPFHCDTCNMRFSKKGNWKKHQGTHVRERNLLCNYCNMKFDDRGNYEAHLVTHTGIIKPYECCFCKRRFSRKNHLSRHVFTHTGERPFGCAECSERFTRREHLERHRLLHTGEMPFECPHCKMRFRRKTYVKTHQCAITTENQLAPEVYL